MLGDKVIVNLRRHLASPFFHTYAQPSWTTSFREGLWSLPFIHCQRPSYLGRRTKFTNMTEKPLLNMSSICQYVSMSKYVFKYAWEVGPVSVGLVNCRYNDHIGLLTCRYNNRVGLLTCRYNNRFGLLTCRYNDRVGLLTCR